MTIIVIVIVIEIIIVSFMVIVMVIVIAKSAADVDAHQVGHEALRNGPVDPVHQDLPSVNDSFLTAT